MKEKIIFALYKDKDIKNVRDFENTIKAKYGFIPSKELSRKIVNYQVEKYGGSINNSRYIEFEKKQMAKNFKKRRREKERDTVLQREKAFIERIEKSKNERFTIKHDEILNKWVVLEKISKNACCQVYTAPRKKDCEKYIKGIKNKQK